MNFNEELKKRTEEAERVIRKYLPEESGFAKTMAEAMNYSMTAGGKRLRPILIRETYRLFGGEGVLCEPFMAAMEMIHTHSLIHDDLPALDNDDYRRGRKTAHIVYGEAMAILAGDSLLNYAYETAAKAYALIPISDIEDTDAMQRELLQRRSVDRAMAVLAAKPGIYGMIGGQVADVELTGTKLTKEQLVYIYENKTGALIEAAMMIGAILAGASEKDIVKVEEAAYNIGMAFQIQDDILDETATFEELGKPIHSDEECGKVTYVTIHGIDESGKEVSRLSNEAIAMLESMGEDAEFLVELTRSLIHRTK